MSFFSNTSTTKYSSNVAVFSDTDPDTLVDIIQTAILNNQDISTSITSGYLYGTATQANSYYKYGRDYFTQGLPDSKNEVVGIDYDAIEIVLEGNRR